MRSFFIFVVGVLGDVVSIKTYKRSLVNGQLPLEPTDLNECDGPWWTPDGGLATYDDQAYAVAIATGTDLDEGLVPAQCGAVYQVRKDGETSQWHYLRINAFDKASTEYDVLISKDHCDAYCGECPCDMQVELATLPFEKSLNLYSSEDAAPAMAIACDGIDLWIDNDPGYGYGDVDGSDSDNAFWIVAAELDESWWKHDLNNNISVSDESSFVLDGGICGNLYSFSTEANDELKFFGEIAGYVNSPSGGGLYQLTLPPPLCEALCCEEDADCECPCPDNEPNCGSVVVPIDCNVIATAEAVAPPDAGTVGWAFTAVAGLPAGPEGVELMTCSAYDWTTSGTDPVTGGSGADFRDAEFALAIGAVAPDESSLSVPLTSGVCGETYKLQVAERYVFVDVAAYDSSEGVEDDSSFYLSINQETCQRLCGKTCLYRVCSEMTIEHIEHPVIPQHLGFYGLYNPQLDAAPAGSVACPDTIWSGTEADGGDGDNEYENFAYAVAIEAAPAEDESESNRILLPSHVALEESCGYLLTLTGTTGETRYLEVAATVDDLFYNSGLFAVEISFQICEDLCGSDIHRNDCLTCGIKIADYLEAVENPRPGETTIQVNAIEAGPCLDNTCSYTITEEDEGCGSEANPCPARQLGELDGAECGDIYLLRSAELASPSENEIRELHIKVVSLLESTSQLSFEISHYGWETLCPLVCEGKRTCSNTCTEEIPARPETSTCSCPQDGETDGTCSNCREGCLVVPGSANTDASKTLHYVHSSKIGNTGDISDSAFVCGVTGVFLASLL